MTKYQLDYLYREESRAEVERLIQDYSRTDPLKVIEVDHGVVLPRIPPENKEKYNWMGKGGVVDKNGGMSICRESGISIKMHLFLEENMI